MNWQTAGCATVIAAGAVVALRAMPFARVVLWSPMKGRVLKDGLPASGAVLVRKCHWHWPDKKITDQAVADADGAFSFPPMTGRMLLGNVLPHEPVVEQSMSVDYLGESLGAWGLFKHNYDLCGEIGRPIDAVLRLDAELSVVGDLTSRCSFL